MTDKIRARFERKYIPEPNSGCWLWIAADNGEGYGAVGAYGKLWTAHPLAAPKSCFWRNVLQEGGEDPWRLSEHHLAGGHAANLGSCRMSDTLRLRTVDQHGEFEAEGPAERVAALWHEWRGQEVVPPAERTGPHSEATVEQPPAAPAVGQNIFKPDGRWTEAQIAYLRASYPDKSISIREISDKLGRSDHTIRVKARTLSLSRRKGRPPAGVRAPERRFTEVKALHPERVTGLAPGHAALREGRTLFPTTVVDARDSQRLLVSGKNSRKLGDVVSKGPWAGWPIFHLTLEERATCPKSCQHWATCYGNGMPLARRHRHGADLEGLLDQELEGLQKVYPEGFVVRLHQLGDFYSVDYVRRWAEWLDRFPALHVFGYTAWPLTSEIGGKLRILAAKRWDRFAIRTSAPESLGGMDAVTAWKMPEGDHTEEGAIVCPAQTGKTSCCGSCGLCWADAAKDRTIAFIAHGSRFLPSQDAPRKAAGAYSRRGGAQKPMRGWPADARQEEAPEPAEKAPGSFGQNLQRRCAAPGCKNIFVTSKVRETVCHECANAEVAA